MWRHIIEGYNIQSLRNASHRALILVLPYVHWDWWKDSWYLVQQWVAATSTVPYTEEVAQSVVDTLLQLTSKEGLLIRIPSHVWLWLTKCPPLPPICLGRNAGTCAHAVKVVQALRNIEVLKSYFLLVWSEWNHFLPNSPDSSHPPPPDGASSHSTIMSFVPPVLPPVLPPMFPPMFLPVLSPFPSVSVPGMGIPIVPVHYPSGSSNSTPSRHTPDNPDSASSITPPLGSTPTPDFVTMPNRHPPCTANSVFSRHTFSSFDSIPGHPPSRILDSTPDRHSSNSPNSVSVCPPPPNTTPSHHPAYITDSVSSRHTSISSDSMPGRPPSPVPVSMPVRYSPPIGGPIFHPSVSHSQIFYPTIPSPIPRPLAPHPQISHSPIFYPPIPSPIPHSQIFYPPSSTPSSAPSPILRLSHIPISMPIIHSFHIPNNMPSSYSSGGFYEMQISIQKYFRGIRMGHHRADLLQRLDQVIGQLDRGLEYLKQHSPEFNEDSLQRTKHQYQYLREMLLEMNMKSDQSCVLFNDHAIPHAHSYPGCTQNPPTHACAHTLSCVHSPMARILGIPTSLCTSISYFVCILTSCSSYTSTSCTVCTSISYFVRTLVLIPARLMYGAPRMGA